MRTIRVHGIAIPLPDNWQPRQGNTSFLGDSGILDVRLKQRGVPIDESRLKVATSEMAMRHGSASIATYSGVPCLFTTYQTQGCIVDTYSFGLAEQFEVVAVYVFRPGHEEQAYEVRLVLDVGK
jgi:hypothetical protein